MHRWLLTLLWLIFIVNGSALLAACGQKGPLYLPDPAQQQEEEKN